MPEVSAVDEMAKATAALAAAEREFASAREADTKAVAAFDEDGASQAAETTAIRARLALERATRRHAARSTDLENARERLAAEQRAQATAEIAEKSAVVRSTAERLAPAIRRLIELDRALSSIVDEVAEAIVDGEQAYDRAQSLAEQIGTPLDSDVRRPLMNSAQYLGRVAIGLSRIREGRDLRATDDVWLTGAFEPLPDPPNPPKPPRRNMPMERGAFEHALQTIESLNLSTTKAK